MPPARPAASPSPSRPRRAASARAPWSRRHRRRRGRTREKPGTTPAAAPAWSAPRTSAPTGPPLRRCFDQQHRRAAPCSKTDTPTKANRTCTGEKGGSLPGDQVIRENPASRGTETSAEVLVGPPLGAGGWSETPVNSSGTRLTLTLDGGLEGPPPPGDGAVPVPIRLLCRRRKGVGGARGLGNLVRPESHPEPRGFPVQWADPGVKPVGDPSDRPVRPRPRARVATGRSGCSHRSTGRLYPCKMCDSERVRMYSD